MTIGIAAVGPNAGLAIFTALRAIERVSSGAIGGFVTYAALDADGNLHRFETQRGGTTTLFTEGEMTGTLPPKVVSTAPYAALMSSGPDRPDPLSQFVTADVGVGLVTGHRLPNAPGVSGRPINQDVLEAMRSGAPSRQAVEDALRDNPMSDAGLIAIDKHGNIFSANSDRVSKRNDLGHARLKKNGTMVEVLHNAIHPKSAVAQLAAAIAMEIMAPPSLPCGYVTLTAGTPLVYGEIDSVSVDENGNVMEVITSDKRIIEGEWNCAAVYIGAQVKQSRRILGYTIFEPNMVVKDGRIESMSGQTTLQLGYAKDPLND